MANHASMNDALVAGVDGLMQVLSAVAGKSVGVVVVAVEIQPSGQVFNTGVHIAGSYDHATMAEILRVGLDRAQTAILDAVEAPPPGTPLS